MRVSMVGAASPNPVASSNNSSSAKAPRQSARAPGQSIIDVGDLPDGVKSGSAPGQSIIDVGDLPDGVKSGSDAARYRSPDGDVLELSSSSLSNGASAAATGGISGISRGGGLGSDLSIIPHISGDASGAAESIAGTTTNDLVFGPSAIRLSSR